MTPDEYCHQKTAQSGSSFYYSFLSLSPERRRAITAFYAFCREVDDIVDESTDSVIAKQELDEWRREVDRLMAHEPTHPVGKALLPHMETCSIRGEHLHALIDGMEMDLGTVRYPDFASLQRYCWHVASVVGLVSAGIFGVTRPETMQYAERLGLAFQLTNIIRDVGDDAKMGRIYLPADELRQFGVSEDDLFNARHSKNFEALMQFQAQRAQAIYEEAFALLPKEDRKAQLPGLIMAAIYRNLLDEIECTGFPVLKKRVSLKTSKKLWLAWKAYLRG